MVWPDLVAAQLTVFRLAVFTLQSHPAGLVGDVAYRFPFRPAPALLALAGPAGRRYPFM